MCEEYELNPEEWEFRPFEARSKGIYNSDTGNIDFFKEASEINLNRITNLDESELTKWVVEKITTLPFYLGFNKIPLIFTEIKKPIVSDSMTPGDIDILMTYDNTPKQAVGIQCKRIKVNYSNTIAKVNKINDIERGVVQSNKMLKKYKFWKNYLIVLIEVDAYTQKNKNVICRHLQDTEKRMIYNYPKQNDLDDEVGLIFIEVVQPAKNSYDDMSNIFIENIKDAKIQTQPDYTNKKVWELIENKEHHGNL